MNKNFRQFLKRVSYYLNNEELRQKIQFNIGKYFSAVEKGLENYFNDFEQAREFISQFKQSVIDDYPFYLNQFVENAEQNGIEVYFARNAEDVAKFVEDLVEELKVRTVVKSKSMVSEELELNKVLESKGVEVYETDLGEFIVQVAGERPFHIVTPAMHKSKQDVIDLYAEKFGIDRNSTVAEVTEFTRQFLRQKFVEADLGITGANFLVADLGAIALTENEGNAFMSFSFPKVHLIITGIEKLIPSYEYLELFWRVLANRGTGQNITVYSHLVFGPKRDDEQDGPQRVILILLDNGRMNLLEDIERRYALKCIRCGACLNYCPVYQTIGGYAYGTVYNGPIGIVISPMMKGIREYGYLSYACTLCRKCEEVCPAKIDLVEMILANRRDYVESGAVSWLEKFAFDVFMDLFVEKSWIYRVMAWIKNIGLRLSDLIVFKGKRKFPKAKKPFRKQIGGKG